MTSPCRQGLFLGLNSDPCPCGGKAPDHELLQGNKKEAPAAPLEDLSVSGTGGGRGGSSHRPTHLCFQKQEGYMKKGREVGGSENSRGRWVFIIYRLLFTVYCSIERTSKWLYGKKKNWEEQTQTECWWVFYATEWRCPGDVFHMVF